MLDLKNKKVLILGAGKTGISTARFLLGKTLELSLSDKNNLPELYKEEINLLCRNGLRTEFGGNSDEFIDNADLVVISPGISPFSELVKKIKEKNTPIISEIELASYFIKKPVIAVTGTNGKTTTTTLINHIINNSGLKSATCGNIGKPLIDIVNEPVDYFILEISSYQIFYSPTFSPYISIFTNITPDHLDWHGDFNHYFNSKKTLFSNMKKDSWSVLNFDDKLVRDIDVNGNKFYFSSSSPQELLQNLDSCAFLENNILKTKFKNNFSDILSSHELKIVGIHNIENALAAMSVAKIISLDDKKVSKSLKEFQGVEHRIEFVREYNYRKFYNDSKATNPESTIKAIESFPEKTITLILGGRDKNTDLSILVECIKSHVNQIILLGEAKDRFKTELEKNNFKNIEIVSSLSDAIKKSLQLSPEIVLFSPACASFDMFRNYEERGNLFKKLVREL